jgi:hypothetical protein
MSRTAQRTSDRARTSRRAWVVAALAAAVGVMVFGAGCTGTQATQSTQKQVGVNMAGPQVQVHIPQSVINAVPRPWDLSTPQSAVRSYLDWTDYAYRTATSDAATATEGADEAVRTDSYIQNNLEHKKILDESIVSLTVGAPSQTATSALVPAKEQWKYQYRSTDVGNQVIAGPFEVSYESTYTVVKNKQGQWVVFAVNARQTGGTLK